MKKYVILILIAFLILLLSLCNYSIFIQKQKLEEKNTLLQSYVKNLKYSKDYQGFFLGEKSDSIINSYSKFMLENSVSCHIFIYLDSISCFSCFKFHMEEIKKIQIPKICVIPNTLYQELVRGYLGEISLFENNELIRLYNSLFDNNLVVAFLDKNGRIIYLDVADKTNYDKSRVFYKVIMNYIGNE